MDDVLDALSGADCPTFLPHRQADRDALGAAIGLRELLGRGVVYPPDGIETRARPLIEATGAGIADAPSRRADAVVVLDAPSSDRVAPAEPAEPVLIDHHQPGDLAGSARASLVDTDASSTSELVCRLAATAGWELSPTAALALATGLFADSDGLRAGTDEAVDAAGRLLSALDDRAGELPALLDAPPADGARNARALGMLRSAGYRAGDVLVGITSVGGHESAAAGVLRDNGVGLAVALNERDGEVRVTARADDGVAERVSVGDGLLPALTAEFGGDGGGHDAAGTASVPGTATAVESFLLDWLEGELGVTFGRVDG